MRYPPPDGECGAATVDTEPRRKVLDKFRVLAPCLVPSASSPISPGDHLRIAASMPRRINLISLLLRDACFGVGVHLFMASTTNGIRRVIHTQIPGHWINNPNGLQDILYILSEETNLGSLGYSSLK
jgi:hypothetical protein